MKPTRGTTRALQARGEELSHKAAKNLDRWGLQTSSVLVLCMAEELGEIARAVLEIKGELGRGRPLDAYRMAGSVRDEALDLGALCLQLAVLCDVGAGPKPDDESKEEGVTV